MPAHGDEGDQHTRARPTGRPDLPFYAGQPVAIGGGGWTVLMASVALALAVLLLVPAATFPATLVPALLFVAIPLVALRLVAGQHWAVLFRPVGLRELGQMLLMGLATVAASVALALVVAPFIDAVPNPRAASDADLGLAAFAVQLLPTLPQFVGEELLAILPFLALLWLATSRLGLSQRWGIVLALVGSSLLFGAAHLTTYDWHWGQSLGLIGGARVVLTLTYLWTRNLWVSAGAHVLNDWTEFALTFVGGHLPVGTEGGTGGLAG